MLINIIAIATFIVGVPAICWGIWNEEKLIEKEKNAWTKFKNGTK